MGNCLDRSISSSSDESEDNHEYESRSRRSRSRRSSGSNRYVQLVDSSHSINSSLLNQNRSMLSHRARINNNTENIFSTSLPNQSFSLTSSQQVYYLTPNVQRTADQLTEEDQIKLLKRMALIQQLPCGAYDENKKHRECVICMIDFEKDDSVKYLPCMHTFHQSCIDAWLVRSLMCPCCMEPVDAGLLAAYE
ncbi:unnamed protein product [Brachionus calyciflorus]|uniref:RING-type domain-containing protein n=1 Tax=Brachionus calyciflorus TaxID=104777 RepID=A0A813NHA2_9BILA|nr:unnamed protein product [Brachionus calyciflorus]